MYVVTVADAGTGERAGCLVGFATQCSISPMRFLVCLSRTNHTHRVAARSGMLAVHALGVERTGDEVDKFTRCSWTSGPQGTPLLDECPRRLVGRVLDRFDVGDHTGYLLESVQQTGVAEPTLMFSAVHDLQAGHPA